MINTVLTAIFGSKNEREMKRLRPIVEAINAWEPKIQGLADARMRQRSAELREQAIRARTEGMERGMGSAAAEKEVLDSLLPEAFALAREAAKRALGMRPFDVQCIGGIILHEGKIAEMKTGEGKTLVATLPVYLNALTGRGVHVVTVNDYLARRDAEWMGEVYRFLGLRVGCVQNQMGDRERQEAYGADVTYGTNSEFGFDYLRDNMKYSLDDYVQREHHYSIVDEVDSILIDEARTPLIISGPSEESTEKYYVCDAVIPKLQGGEHYEVDEKSRTAVLTESGVDRAEKVLGLQNLYDPQNVEILHGVEQALRAHALYKRDRDYMLRDGQVLIVDEFTGRVLPGRRWSDGLHQAVEAKEKVKIEKENQTLATITYQNYFRMYEKLAGMTGTADTEAEEFAKIYNLDVVVIPTNRPLRRIENPDVVFRTEGEKYRAIVGEIADLHERQQPVLVGTVSIEKSERISEMLKRKAIPHVVLNAKYHEKEAEIVAQAGRKGTVTIATNMAGRGTDIVLGGNPESLARLAAGGDTSVDTYRDALGRFREVCGEEHGEVIRLGGLHILGTERHEARRIDNQLRGRSGRQGDPGSSRFYLSLEDDLMRIFARDWVAGFLQRLGMEEDVPIEHGMVTRAIERAQKQVEQHNFDIRKHLLEYDDVMNKQRTEIYSLRRELLSGAEQKDYVLRIAEDIFEEVLERHLPEEASPSEWTGEEFLKEVYNFYGLSCPPGTIDWSTWNRKQVREQVWGDVLAKYREKEARLAPENMRVFERLVILRVIDTQWKDHLLALDHLKEGIGLRGYGQRDPLVEYKRESFELFAGMKQRIEDEICRRLFLLEPVLRTEQQYVEKQREKVRHYDAVGGGAPAAPKTVVHKGKKVGRNDPCPCGSGKKYKKCCGAGVAA